jgi:ubiquinone/menaquinone biosynthesis C-methylase UbiE
MGLAGLSERLHRAGYTRRITRWRARALGRSPAKPGTITWKVGDLCRIPEIPDGYFDAVVSLSAIEHIPEAMLPVAWRELCRVVRPGGRWAITTSASGTDSSWFHEPSRGWCFSRRDLEQRFGAAFAGPLSAAEALHRYRESAYLRKNLAYFYRKSGNNGMPWGVWDPRYIPVGIRLSP